jgi:DNA (cytosine-5)-methyltransferase 1
MHAVIAARAKGVPSLDSFLNSRIETARPRFAAVSLFSGGGVGDFGYSLAGFRFVVHAEREPGRLRLALLNHRGSRGVLGDLRETWRSVISEYEGVSGGRRLDLLVGMAPCQGLTTASPQALARRRGRYSRDRRNILSFVVSDVAAALQPRVVVIENVKAILDTRVKDPASGLVDSVSSLLEERMPKYRCHRKLVQFADYGVPQRRRRVIFTFIRKGDGAEAAVDRLRLEPFPERTHDQSARGGLRPWVTVKEFLRSREFPRLSASNEKSSRDPVDPLHYVPWYDPDRFRLVASIPPNSGRSAFKNDICPSCGTAGQPAKAARCFVCRSVLYVRPVVVGPRGGTRLIRGRETTYQRMPPHLPAPTITTANGNLGSDSKIHPWEHRLLSPRECLELQTVPSAYRWSEEGAVPTTKALRQVIGEAAPPWFTYRHGLVLTRLLGADAKP